MKNSELLERSLASVWHPCTQMKQHPLLPLVPIERGQGAWLYDFEGRRYLDAVSSWWVNLFGHGNAFINRAIRDQLEQIEHVMLAGLTHRAVIELSEKLARITPGNLGHAFYGSDGASAIEIALKMSFHYWRNCGQTAKKDFISLKNGYHGETLGALSVTDIPLFRDTYSPLLMQHYQVMTPDWRFAEPGETPLDFARRAALDLENFLAEHHRHVAALIVEPLVQGASGMGMHHPEYLTRARMLCDRFEVHLIADEIAVGFGRTGTMFACEQAGIVPDLLCLSKGITGGYLPLSVVMSSNRIYQAFYHDRIAKGFLHSHSYTGNALACKAALATLELFEQNDALGQNRERALQMNRALQPLANHPRVRNFRNTGMIWAFEVDDAPPDFSQNFFKAALGRELLLRPIGNTVYFMPPYVVGREEIELLASRTLELVEQTR